MLDGKNGATAHRCKRTNLTESVLRELSDEKHIRQAFFLISNHYTKSILPPSPASQFSKSWSTGIQDDSDPSQLQPDLNRMAVLHRKRRHSETGHIIPHHKLLIL